MGYHTELNTLLGIPADFDVKTLVVGKKYTITRDRERSFPLHIAMLMVTPDWDFLGYAVVHSSINKDFKCTLEFEVISLFSPDELKLYKKKFLEAARFTGEVK
jgi:hypothetical protein